MKILTKGLLIAVLGFGMTLPAVAGSSFYNHPGSHEKGVRSGEMVRKAAWGSQQKQLRIRQVRRDYPDQRRYSKYRYNRFKRSHRRPYYRYNRFSRYHQRPYYSYRAQHRHPNLFWDLFYHNR